MKAKRIHILSAVNAANVSKSGSTYTVKDVCGAVDGLVMNSMLYPADQLAAGVASLEGKPAPAGHPKNAAGQHISALNGDALLTSYAGAICRNARHEGGRTLVDLVVNEAQAKAHPDGAKLVERLDAAINGTSADPIHVSTGLICKAITANGESNGKQYSRIATEINYDHVAFLLHEQGAGTPADGVGMFLNAQGEADEVETVTINTEPEDKRSTGLKAWVNRLLGNSSNDVSFDQITSGLYALMPEGSWIRDVFDRYAIWTDKDGKHYRQDYAVGSDGSVAFSNDPVEVVRQVEYKPVTNSEKVDTVKDKILAALNAAGISAEGKDDVQLLTAYNALIVKPVDDKLTAANSKLAEFEVNAAAARDAEVTALAQALAVNSSLTVDDLKKLGLDRLKEIQANAKTAAPVITGNAGAKGGAEWYDINKLEA
jgi:Uncharacterized protein conserved in bacteria (DUF2213)